MNITLLRQLRKEFRTSLQLEGGWFTRIYAFLRGERYIQRVKSFNRYPNYVDARTKAIREFQYNVLTHYVKQKRKQMKIIKIKVPILKRRETISRNLTVGDLFNFTREISYKKMTNFKSRCRFILGSYIDKKEESWKFDLCAKQMEELFNDTLQELQIDLEDKFGNKGVDFTEY